MTEESNLDIPEAPRGLPEGLAKKWLSAYENGYLDAQRDEPEHPQTWPGRALREANKVLRFGDPQSHAEAMSMPEWQVIHRRPSKDGKTLDVVTRHGKKFKFPLPAETQKKTAAS